MQRYTIFSGSTRRASQTSKVARYISEQVTKLNPKSVGEVVDLSKIELPQWHEDFGQGEEKADAAWRRVAAALRESTGIIVVAPEWNGMVPPALMNVFLLGTGGELAHKPALIVTVSANRGGAYPVAQLRAFGPKNTHICYIPEHVIVRGAREVLNGPEPSSDADTELRERIRYALSVLEVYAAAFVQIRSSGVIDHENYPNGM